MLTNINHEVADAAHRQRARNLGQVLNYPNDLPKGGTPFQRETLASFRHAGLSAFAQSDGTIHATEYRPAPNGGYTEEWVTLVTHKDRVAHLGNPYAT